MKSDLMFIAKVAAGVIVAGYVMYSFRSNVELLNQAHSGFDSGV